MNEVVIFQLDQNEAHCLATMGPNLPSVKELMTLTGGCEPLCSQYRQLLEKFSIIGHTILEHRREQEVMRLEEAVKERDTMIKKLQTQMNDLADFIHKNLKQDAS